MFFWRDYRRRLVIVRNDRSCVLLPLEAFQWDKAWRWKAMALVDWPCVNAG
jgi:hypothetical protein